MLAIAYPDHIAIDKTQVNQSRVLANCKYIQDPFKSLHSILEIVTTYSTFIASDQNKNPQSIYRQGKKKYIKIKGVQPTIQDDVASLTTHTAVLDLDRKPHTNPTATNKQEVMKALSLHFGIALYSKSATDHALFKGRIFIPSASSFDKKEFEAYLHQFFYQRFNSKQTEARVEANYNFYKSLSSQVPFINHEFIDTSAFNRKHKEHTYQNPIEVYHNGKYIDTIPYNTPYTHLTDLKVTTHLSTYTATDQEIPTELGTTPQEEIDRITNTVEQRAKKEGRTTQDYVRQKMSSTYDRTTTVVTDTTKHPTPLHQLVAISKHNHSIIQCGFGVSRSRPTGHIYIRNGTVTDYDSGLKTTITYQDTKELNAHTEAIKHNLQLDYTSSTLHKLTKGFEQVWLKWGNYPSMALKMQWSQVFNSLDRTYTDNLDHKKEQTLVITDPTGGGKTSVLCYYLAHNDIMSLVVTNENAEADEIVNTINNYRLLNSQEPHAVVYNTDKDKENLTPRANNIPEAQQATVLVISHSRYETAVKNNHIYTQLTYNRDLIAIDEELTVMDDVVITKTDLARLVSLLTSLGTAPQELMDKLQLLVTTMSSNTELMWTDYEEETVETLDGLELMPLSLTELSKVIENANTDFNFVLAGQRNTSLSENIKKQMLTFIEQYDKIYSSFCFSINHGGTPVIASGSLYIPKKCQIVFDATANVNPFYQLQKDNIELIPRIPNTRNYQNATLHTVKMYSGHNTWVGKNYESVDKSVDVILSEVLGKYNGEPTLIVSFLDLDEALIARLGSLELLYTEDYPDRPIHVAHWGGVTGKNTWQYCSKVFLFGLFRKHPAYYKIREAAMTSPEEAFAIDEEESHSRLEREEAILHEDLIAGIIQAINRGRSRRTIDVEGNCASIDIYLNTPVHREWGDKTLDIIADQMPNITLADWEIEEETAHLAPIKEDNLIDSVMKDLHGYWELGKGESLSIQLIGKKLKSPESTLNKAITVNEELLRKKGYLIEGKKYKSIRRVK